MRTLCPAPVETADGLGYCNRPILVGGMCVKHLREHGYLPEQEDDNA